VTWALIRSQRKSIVRSPTDYNYRLCARDIEYRPEKSACTEAFPPPTSSPKRPEAIPTWQAEIEATTHEG
jgi:hypothetical protein